MRRFTVLGLVRELEAVVSGRFPVVEVEGEVGQLSTPVSGHAYLTLRDGPGADPAVLPVVVWRDTWRQLRERPAVGHRVVCRGRLGLYVARGSYQLVAFDVQRAGDGGFAAELARRLARLTADGLLDPARKRPLPAVPRVIGVATSTTGAALQDFLEVSRRRFPAARILVAHCTVQGPTAPGSVVEALDLLLEDGRAEVLVVTRGGGSKEDLLAFQDEGLARFVAASPVPVVSAVGHQIDTTLVDLVADAVAPTPSAAAVRVLPDGAVLARRVDEAASALAAALSRGLRGRRERVRLVAARLRHPGAHTRRVRERARVAERRLVARLLLELRLRRRGLSALGARLLASVASGLPGRRRALAALVARLGAASRRAPARRRELSLLEDRLDAAMDRALALRRARVALALARADALSPQGVLRRGFAVVTGPGGVVSRVADAAPGATLEVRVVDGRFSVTVLPGPR